MALEESGLRLTAEGGSEFESTLRGANDAVEGFGQAASRAASPLDAFGEIATGALRRVGEIAVNALGAAAGAVGGFISDSFAGALEAEQTLTRISSVIESTGSAAGLSVRDVERLGNEFAHLAGGSDDAVLAIQEMALRLGTVSAEEMPDFIQTTLDLAAATGVDAVAAARTLAVAQEDPISALGRLRKSGILLTEAQEEQIKKMQEAGDSAGAYALLIEQVGEATGGAALANSQTLAGQMEIFKNTIGEAGESIATAFLPILNQLFTNVLGPAIPIITELANAFGGFVGLILEGEFAAAIDSLGEWEVLQNVFQALGISIYELEDPFENLMASFQSFGAMIGESLVPLQAALGELFTAIFGQMPPAQTIIETVMTAISNAVTVAAGFISGTLVPALTSAVEWVTMNWPQIQAVIQSVMDAVGIAIQLEIAYLQRVVIPVFQSVVDWVVANWPAIQETIIGVMTAVQTVVNDVITFITSYWQANGATIISDTQSTWSGIQEFISNAITTVQTVVTTVLSAIQAFWDAHGQSIITIVTVTWNTTQSVISTVVGVIQGIISVFTAVVSALWQQWGSTILAIAAAVWSAVQTVIQNAVTIIGAIIDAFAALLTGDWQALGQSLDLIWRTLWSTIGTVLSTAVASILAIISTAIRNIVAAFQSVDWGALGMSIIDGIRNGIGNAIGGLVQAAADAAWAAFQAAKDALGIGSPSRVMADLVGVPFAEGMAAGIGRGTSVVVDAARQLGFAAVDSAGRAVGEAMADVNPWAAILGGGLTDAGRGGGSSIVNPLEGFLSSGGYSVAPSPDFGFGGGPVTSPPADSFGFGGGPVSAPPISGGPTLGGGPIEGGGGGSINITVNAQGASPTQTQAAVTRALRDAGQYSDTRLRLRGAM